MQDGDVDECPICTDAMRLGDSIHLPGCRHRFHVKCVMNFCRYNTHCPICRQLPDGVQSHETPAQVITTTTPVLISLEDIMRDVENATDERRRTWRRYRNRRRRALNNNPRLTSLFDRLQLLRRDMDVLRQNTQRMYNQRCRDVWRTDPELVEYRRVITRMRRRERYIERSVYNQLHDLVGSEP